MLILKSFGIWFILAVFAIVVATFRNGVLLPSFGEHTAHQLGTVLYLIVQFIIIFLFIKKMKIKEVKTLLVVGIFWVFITIIFEFVLWAIIGKNYLPTIIFLTEGFGLLL